MKNCTWIKTEDKHSNGMTIHVCAAGCGNQCVSDDEQPKMLAMCRHHYRNGFLAVMKTQSEKMPEPKPKKCGGCGAKNIEKLRNRHKGK